jgi:hypothetical protein
LWGGVRVSYVLYLALDLGLIIRWVSRFFGEKIPAVFGVANNAIWQDRASEDFFTKFFKEVGTAESRDRVDLAINMSFPVSELPIELRDLPNDILLYLVYHVGEIPAHKSVGLGLLTGLITGIVTGGAYIHVSTLISGSVVDAYVLDKTNGKLLWHNHSKRIARANEKSTKDIVEHLFKLLPPTAASKPTD